jgi:glyoxylase-like metal-dependent hydrolase (beta-lactamase superfamily II)
VDIRTLDLDFQGLPHTIASHLVAGPGGPVLIETGPGSTLETLKRRLAENGYAAEDVRHVFVTHVHLDHAGAAGWFARQGARVYVHPVGAPHVVDPSRLLASAGRIYGDRMDALWGETLPAPPERVTEVSDGDVIDAAGLEVHVIETAGHARHHHAYRVGDVAFVGDAGGVRIDGAPHIDLTAVPPEFDREAWLRSIDRLAREDLAAIYPTHYGRSEGVATHWTALRDLIAEATGFVHGMLRLGADRDTIVREYTAWMHDRAAAAGAGVASIGQSDLANPLGMSVDGISRYWHKRGV